jgi:hypothetical protein
MAKDAAEMESDRGEKAGFDPRSGKVSGSGAGAGGNEDSDEDYDGDLHGQSGPRAKPGQGPR